MEPQTTQSGAAPSTSSSLDPQTVNLVKAIRQTESGGNFTAKGKSGEYGAYQYTAPTWAKDSANAGVNVPLEQATPEQQNEVAYKTIKGWKDKGFNVGQIASMWNAGEGKPDAYLEGNAGTNKFGAQYDTAKYAKSVATAYQTLKNGGQVGADPNNPSSVNSTQNANAQPTQQKDQSPSVGGFLQNFLGSAGNFAGGLLNAVEHPIDTATNLGSTALGLGEQGLNTLGVSNFKDQNVDRATNLENTYKGRYGGLSNIAHTAYTDPVGMLADVSTLFGGVSGVAKGVGALADAGKAADVANLGEDVIYAGGKTAGGEAVANGVAPASKMSGFSKFSNMASKVSEATNPLTMPAKALGGLSDVLSNSAEKSYVSALSPTKEVNKFLADGVVKGKDITLPTGEQFHVPGLLERGVVAPTLESLSSKIDQGIEQAGKGIEAADAKIPGDTEVNINPVLDQIEAAKKQFTIAGKNGDVIADPTAVQHLQDFQDTVKALADETGNTTKDALTQLKRLWQAKVVKSGAYYGKTMAEGTQADLMDTSEQAVRNVLNGKFPDTAKANAEYSFWKNAQKVVDDTMKRKSGQSGIVRHGLYQGLGAIAGAPFGVGGVAGGAYAARLVSDVLNSPGWKTASAVVKNKLAHAIASGDIANVSKIAGSILTPAVQINQATASAPTTK